MTSLPPSIKPIKTLGPRARRHLAADTDPADLRSKVRLHLPDKGLPDPASNRISQRACPLKDGLRFSPREPGK